MAAQTIETKVTWNAMPLKLVFYIWAFSSIDIFKLCAFTGYVGFRGSQQVNTFT